MANSLTIGGLEQVGDVTNPEYRLGKHSNDGLGSGLDFGETVPDTDVISSLLLDGDIVTGERTGNRTWNLITVVQGSDRADLSAKVNTFVQTINADSYPVVWTPDGCPSSVFTAYRAAFSVAKDFNKNGQLVAEVVYSFETGPFARSMDPQSVTVAATGGPAALQIDGMNSGTFLLSATLDTVTKYEGAGSGKIHSTVITGPPSRSSSAIGRTISAVDISAYGSLTVRIRAAATITPSASWVLALLDSHGATWSVPAGSNPQLTTTWKVLTFDLASAVGVIDLTSITQWNISGSSSPSVGGTQINVDDLRAIPPASVGNSTAEGSVLTIPAVQGSARTPVAVSVARASGNLSDLLLHSPPGGQDPDLTILAGLSAGSVTIPAANMHYDSTYSLLAFFSATGTGARTVTATVTQQLSATTIATQILVLNFAGTGERILSLGEVTLPLVAVPPENTASSITIAITSTNGTDTFSDVALCDSEGQTVLLPVLSPNLTVAYVDAPDPAVGVGPVYGALSGFGTDRSTAISQAAFALIGGGPMLFEPGDNRLLVASTAGAPNVTVTFTPAWLDEAQV